MPLRTLRCASEDMETWYPRLFLEPHIVACVAVLSRYSASPAMLHVTCEGITSRWLGKDTAFRLEGTDGREGKPVARDYAAIRQAFVPRRKVLSCGLLLSAEH